MILANQASSVLESGMLAQHSGRSMDLLSIWAPDVGLMERRLKLNHHVIIL